MREVPAAVVTVYDAEQAAAVVRHFEASLAELAAELEQQPDRKEGDADGRNADLQPAVP